MSVHSPMFRAAIMGEIETVRLELERNVDINSFNADPTVGSPWTPLQFAVHSGCLRVQLGRPQNNTMVEFLLQNGADPNLKDNEGLSPVHICSDFGNMPYLRLLVQYKADVNLTNQDGKTPLHICASKGNVPYAEFLILRGAHINSLDNDDRTPLIAAVTVPGNSAIVEWLIFNGANILLRGVDGHNAESLSITLHHDAITAVIRAAVLIREKCVAFASGSVERLGSASRVNSIDLLAMHMILNMVLYERDEILSTI